MDTISSTSLGFVTSHSGIPTKWVHTFGVGDCLSRCPTNSCCNNIRAKSTVSCSSEQNQHLSRRTFFQVGTYSTLVSLLGWSALARSSQAETAIAAPSVAQNSSKFKALESRLELDIIKQPGLAPFATELFYPEWILGEWNTSTTLINVKAPLGEEFVRQDTVAMAQKQLNRTNQFPVRFIKLRIRDSEADTTANPDPNSNEQVKIIADRIYNTISSTNGYAQRDVVERVVYDVKSPNKVITIYRGNAGARSILFINNRRGESGVDPETGVPVFVCTEFYRQVFFNPSNLESNGPRTTDYEIVTKFVLESNDVMSARQRVAVYLQPLEEKFFDAGKRAVFLTDYDIKLERRT